MLITSALMNTRILRTAMSNARRRATSEIVGQRVFVEGDEQLVNAGVLEAVWVVDDDLVGALCHIRTEAEHVDRMVTRDLFSALYAS